MTFSDTKLLIFKGTVLVDGWNDLKMSEVRQFFLFKKSKSLSKYYQVKPKEYIPCIIMHLKDNHNNNPHLSQSHREREKGWDGDGDSDCRKKNQQRTKRNNNKKKKLKNPFDKKKYVRILYTILCGWLHYPFHFEGFSIRQQNQNELCSLFLRGWMVVVVRCGVKKEEAE